ncbi:MAG: ATP-binding protein [Bacilli bacterium]|nr:ATP-binding protein [Bacilli bacterium]
MQEKTFTDEEIEKFFPSLKNGLKGEDPKFIEEEKKAERVRRLGVFKNSGFPERFHGANIKDLNEKQRVVAENFLKQIEEGKSASLWFCGNAGTGKTCLASAIAKEVALSGKTVKYVKSHLLVGQLKKNQVTIENIIYELKNNYLVVIDEVGRYPEPLWESYYIFAIMDEMYSLGRAVIMISNLGKKNLGELLGAACVDRFNGVTKSVEFDGSSYRGTDNELYV